MLRGEAVEHRDDFRLGEKSDRDGLGEGAGIGVKTTAMQVDQHAATIGVADLPRTRYGFPQVPGVLAAARRPFLATGLGLPWYAVHGNHDNMLQGTVPPAGWLHDLPAGPVKFVTPPDGVDPAGVLARFHSAQADALLELAGSVQLTVTPDPGRTPVTRASHVREHFRTTGQPVGHGYSQRNADEGTAYYSFDHASVRCIVLDTVNPHGGWQGSLDTGQPAIASDRAGHRGRRHLRPRWHHQRAHRR